MIDGITILDDIANFEAWKSKVKIDFTTRINTDTGEILTKKREQKLVTTHSGKFETFDLTVKEVTYIDTGKKIFYLTIKGSLHKNHYGGKNYLPFTWLQLQQQIEHIATALLIDPNTAQISMMEVGVNIETPFEVTPFIMQNLVDYKGKRFNHYPPDKNGVCLGVYCELEQYKIKIYDKGLQHQLQKNLMRFEKRFLRMQQLKDVGIKYLADLQNKEKVKNLLPMLLDAWNNVLVYDIPNLSELLQTNIKLQKLAKTCETLQNPTKPNNIKKCDIDLLTNGQHPKFWEQLKNENKNNRRKYNYPRDKFKKLVCKYGYNLQQNATLLIEDNWKELFKNCTKLQGGENTKLYKITLKIKGNIVQNKICVGCGKDISHQQNTSDTCTGKYVGYKAAHDCRNVKYNPQNNLKNKLKKLTSRGLLFDITPYFINHSKINFK